jgi:hypothetical protein
MNELRIMKTARMIFYARCLTVLLFRHPYVTIISLYLIIYLVTMTYSPYIRNCLSYVT